MNSDGTLAAGSHVSSVSKTSGLTGFYQVVFDQNGAGCAAVATVNNASYGDIAPFSNFVNVFIWAGYDIFGGPSNKDANFLWRCSVNG